MQNTCFKAEILPQDYQLVALPLDSGATVLLSIGPQGELFLIRAAQDDSAGWEREDITVAVADDLPGGRCRLFAAARPLPVANRSGTIDLAMVVNDGHGDHLYLSMANPAFDACWTTAPAWTVCPFDAGTAPARLRITSLAVSDTNDDRFVIVEVANPPRDAGDDAAGPARYIVRPGDDGGPRWQRHRMPPSAHGPAYAACLGRSRNGGNVDGLYLAGWADGAVQLAYAPLMNPFRPELPPQTRRLDLPGKLGTEALAACRGMDNTTDLYAIAQGTLFYFSATNQGDRAQALPVLTSALFDDMRQLFATAGPGRLTLWGLNGLGQVIHTCVDDALIVEPSAWSDPVVVLEQAWTIAPSRERSHAAEALFAQTPEGLVKLARPSSCDPWRREAVSPALVYSAKPAHRMAAPRSLVLAKAASLLARPLATELAT